MFNTLLDKLFSRLSISQRILLGFVILLFISFSLLAMSIYGLKKSHQRFIHFSNVSEDTNLMLQIDNNIAEMQREIVVFSNAEKNSTSAPLTELHNALLSDIRKLVENNSFSDGADIEQLLQMQRGVESFSEKIINLENQRDYRDSLVDGELVAHYQRINEALLERLAQVGGKEREILLRVQFNILRSEVFVSRYFSSHDIQLRKQVLLHLQEAVKVLDGLGGGREGIALRLKNALASIKLLLNKAVQADRNYLFLVNVVIAGESYELRVLSEHLKAAALEDQQRVFAISDRQINIYQRVLFVSSVLAILLVIGVAVLTGKRISRPIESITATFARLAKGEHLSEIPGMNRLDEIGSLAQAANVFRETNARTQALLEKSELLTLELKQREHSLELAVEEARQASLAKSQFLANMSHELRTPMNAVLGMLSLLRKTPLDQVQLDYAVKTDSAARSLLALLNDILDISKAEAGRMQLDPHPFDLRKILDELNLILANNLVAKPVRLLIEVAADVPERFIGDALRLKQVLINLGGNAIKFTDQGQVTIRVASMGASAQGVMLRFSVQDSGIGIAPENQSKIFQGFTQAESSTTRRFGGTGLGLAISQHLVGMMGGSIELNSEVGEGSCFYFSIILPEDTSKAFTSLSALAAVAVQPQTKRLAGVRILLAEDNLINQQVASELLSSEGAVVEIAHNGQEALDLLQAKGVDNFDVVLMDIQMPVMDGYTATDKLRNEFGWHALPIVAMTANVMPSDREACLAAGMNAHVGKPFDLDDLVVLLLSFTGRSDASQANLQKS